MVSSGKKGPQCHYCKKYGHIKKNCLERAKQENSERKKGKKSNKVGLLTYHVLGVTDPAHNWIIDSGATCHICNSKEMFEEFNPLSKSQKVTLGDGRTLEAIGTGVVEVKLKLAGGRSKVGRLTEVLYVPTLAYNLLSVSKATEAGKKVTFGETRGEVIDDQGEVVAAATKAGSLYYLNCEPMSNQINSTSHQSNQTLWHRRFGHLGEKSLHKLKKDGLVRGLNYDVSKEIDFCEACVCGKIHRSPFPKAGHERAEEPLGLVHSDVCGKMGSQSLGSAEYFVTFVDDRTTMSGST